MERIEFRELAPKVVLGVGAHADDLDFMSAGTMARFARGGAACYYLVLTDGSAGSADRDMDTSKLIALRRAEQTEAGRRLGLREVFFGDWRDGTLANTLEVKREVVRYIRRVKPDVVISIDPSVLFVPQYQFINHPDHRAAGQAALDAVFPLARDHMSFPELLAEGLEPHKTGTVLLSNMAAPNYGVDITDTLELKFEALAAHASQIPDLTQMRRVFTERARATGRAFGYKYAEGFVRVDVRG